MANVIKFKRGNDASLPNPASSGEPLWSEDNFKLYVGINTSSSKWVGAEIDNGTSLGTSQVKLATQYAVKTYVDAQVATKDTLAELGDTNITSPADATLLLYDTGTSTWRDGAMSGDATISDTGAITIAADAVSNTKLANITRGSVKVGGGSDAPTDLVAKTSGQILVGDGTDIASVAVSGDIALAANGAMTIQASSVALTTDTTGDYVGTITGGVGVDSTAATSGEGTTHTLSLDLNELSAATVATGDKVAFVDVTDNSSKLETIDDIATLFAGTGITASSGVLSIDAAQAITSVTGDFTVTGDLVVSGDTVTTNVATVEIEDPMIRLATSNAADTYDMGMYGKYVASGTKYSGVFRDRSVTGDPWTFFDTLSTEPAAAGDVTVGSNNFEYAPLRCADITGSGATSGNGTLSGFDVDGGSY